MPETGWFNACLIDLHEVHVGLLAALQDRRQQLPPRHPLAPATGTRSGGRNCLVLRFGVKVPFCNE